VNNGWTWLTALCTCSSLLHWPCATTLLTALKETGSKKWTLSLSHTHWNAFLVCLVVAHP
jgi:ferrous iron transport protein B